MNENFYYDNRNWIDPNSNKATIITRTLNKNMQQGFLPGAVMGGPASDEVMKKIPGRQGHPGPHPWRGHEEKTWQARPSRIREPPGWPRPLPHPVSSPPFCLFALLRILVLLPKALLLLFDWILTKLKPYLINILDAGTLWRGQGWRKCFSSNPFAGILACLIHVCSHCTKCSWLF